MTRQKEVASCPISKSPVWRLFYLGNDIRNLLGGLHWGQPLLVLLYRGGLLTLIGYNDWQKSLASHWYREERLAYLDRYHEER